MGLDLLLQEMDLEPVPFKLRLVDVDPQPRDLVGQVLELLIYLVELLDAVVSEVDGRGRILHRVKAGEVLGKDPDGPDDISVGEHQISAGNKYDYQGCHKDQELQEKDPSVIAEDIRVYQHVKGKSNILSRKIDGCVKGCCKGSTHTQSRQHPGDRIREGVPSSEYPEHHEQRDHLDLRLQDGYAEHAVQLVHSNRTFQHCC